MFYSFFDVAQQDKRNSSIVFVSMIICFFIRSESSVEQKSDSTSQLLDEQATVDQLISSIIDNVIEQIDTSRVSFIDENRIFSSDQT